MAMFSVRSVSAAATVYWQRLAAERQFHRPRLLAFDANDRLDRLGVGVVERHPQRLHQPVRLGAR